MEGKIIIKADHEPAVERLVKDRGLEEFCVGSSGSDGVVASIGQAVEEAARGG